MVLLSLPILGQKLVSGKITASDGEGLPGVTIQIEGTMRGTISDIDGNYSVQASQEEVLIFSSIGFTTQKIQVGNQSQISIALEQDVQELEEFVVIGYGSRAKRDLTGSMVSMNAEELTATPVTSPEMALQGRAAGVTVVQNSGEPGASSSIRIRGTSSITAGNEPLYVIDGIPILSASGDATTGQAKGNQLNPLATINTNDIVSMEVLKDASAAAIYGARGANGVILITTKRGKAGKAKVNFSTYKGVQVVTNQYELLNASQFAFFVNEASFNAGNGRVYTDPTQFGEGTDWQEEVFQSAPIANYDLSVSGGSEKFTYSLSGNYFEQEGVIVGSDFKRYSSRINVDAKINSNFKIQNTLLASHVRSRKVQTDDDAAFDGGAVTAALSYNPMLPLRFASGSFVDRNYRVADDGSIIINDSNNQPLNTAANPILKNLGSPSSSKLTRIIENLAGTLTIAKDFELRVSGGVDFSTSREDDFTPSATRSGGDAFGLAGSSSSLTLLNENTLKYTKAVGVHDFDAVVGFTAQKTNISNLLAQAIRFDTELLGFHDLSLAEGVELNNGQSEFTFLSFLGRVNYVLKDKYLVTLTARRDGSSKFGANNKWGFFPSASVAWRISDEPIVDALNIFQDFKLRVGYGIVGNESIGPYLSLSPLIPVETSFNEVLVFGFEPFFLPNADLKWESTEQLNIGADISVLEGRVNLTTDYYIKKTSDLLLSTQVPLYTGFGSVLGNVGDLENKGFELSISTNNFVEEFKWNTSLNFSTNKNTILNLADRDSIPNASNLFGKGTWALLVEGQEVGTFYGYVADGIVQIGDNIESTPAFSGESLQPGDRKYKDINGDGIISADADRAFIGRAQPRYNFGIDNNFSYKGFDLNVFFQGVIGNDIMNFNKFLTERQNATSNISLEYFANRWTPSNPSNEYPRVTDRGLNAPISSAQVEDGSYLRLKSVTLAYNLPATLLQNLKLSSARVYVTAKNLLTVTGYSGYDPEVSHFGQSPTNAGADLGGFPNSKMYSIGVNLSF